MKILYAASDRPSSILQAKNIIENLKNHFEIKIAGFDNLINEYQLDWFINPLYSNFNRRKLPKLKEKYNCNISLVDVELFENLLFSIDVYRPDLIISDNQTEINAIGHILNIETWDVSSINHLWSASEFTWDFFYYHILYYYKRDYLNRTPPSKSFVYSPFYLLNFPILADQEYIRPFDTSTEITNDIVVTSFKRENLRNIFSNFRNIKYNTNLFEIGNMNFITGETCYLNEIIKSGKYYHIMPNLKDIETLVNAVITRTLMSGIDLGQIELMQEHAHARIERMIDIKLDYLVNDKKVPNLLEKIYEKVERV